MKVRTGFVTNSSSSSFVVIMNEDFKTNDTLLNATLEYVIHQFDRYSDGCINNEQEIMQYIMSKYDLDGELPVLVDEDASNEFKEMQEYLEKGFSIIQLDSISDSSALYDLLVAISREKNDYIVVKNSY